MTYYAAVPHADGKDGPSSIVETADHIDLAWTGTWGDSVTVEGRAALRDLTVKYLQEAKERGITKAMVTVDYFLWVTLGNNHTAYRGSEFVTTEARLLFDRLKAEGLLDMVTVVYPQDEPEIYGIDGTMFCLAISDIRGVLSEYPELAKTKVAVIYAANHGYPGIDCVDIAGFDDYDSRDRIFTNGDYTRFVSMLRADQQTLLVAGGSEPWLQDPTPFYQKAIADNRVYALVGFVWFDQYGQTSYRGIRSAPTRQSFCTVGRHLIGNSTPCL